MIRLFFLILIPVALLATREQSLIYAFWDLEGYKKTRMIVVGETVTFKKAAVTEFKSSLDLAVDTRPDVVTVKLYHTEGIRPGQTLYLIEKSFDHKKDNQGNIVGQITVKSVFTTTFFGTQLRGEGYLRMMDGRVMIVAKPIASEKGTDAFLIAKDADFFLARGDIEKAITLYKKAIDLDPSNPSHHFFLGKIHLAGGEGHISAGFEYSLAWKYRQQFQSINDEISFYRNYINYLLDRAAGEKFKKSAYLEKAVEVYNAASRKTDNFELKVNGSLAHAYLSRELEKTLQGSDRRQKQETLLGIAADLIKSAGMMQKNDYRYHQTAVIVNYEIFRSLYYQNSLSNEGQKLKKNIRYHENSYKRLKPAGTPVNKEVSAILNMLK